MFNRTENFNCDLSCWDISHVKSVAYMFAYALLFDYNLSSWHISRECATDNMFIGSPLENNKPYWYANIEYYNKQNEKTKHIKDRFVPLNNNELKAIANNDSIPLKNIDISHVSDFSELFKYSERSDFKDIELWNVSHVKNMNEMFYNCDFFNGNINNWNISNVANMEDMFVGVDEEYIPKWYNSKYNGFYIRIKAEE